MSYGSFRTQIQEMDISTYASASTNETGAMVINSSKGPVVPVKCSSEDEVLTYFGYPSAVYPEVFEALSFVQEAPCWIGSAVNSDARYGGIQVNSGTINALSSGIVDPDNYEFSDNTISHIFFAASPYEDDLKINLKMYNNQSDQYTLTLYQENTNGSNVYITEYNYSLSRVKNDFGKSLYIGDVFNKNKYLKYAVNSSYSDTTPTFSTVTATTALGGGTRGSTPTTANYTTVWDYFKKPNKYPAKIFMDVAGNSQTTLVTLLETYHYSHGITIVPMGNDADSAATVVSGWGIDSDRLSTYTNWRKIYDPYNDSYAWISNVGSIGKKYAQMSDVYDGLAPAGIDENSHGGQISDWTTNEVENDYDDTDLETLDNGKINPMIWDDDYGFMIYGNKTMQTTLSDTSYIHTRRIYNLIIEKVAKNILRLQEFKLNDTMHRLKAKTKTETLLKPILAQELLREAAVICDTSNNTDDVLELRQFILDIYVKATPDSEFCKLRLTRVSQNTVIADLIS